MVSYCFVVFLHRASQGVLESCWVTVPLMFLQTGGRIFCGETPAVLAFGQAAFQAMTLTVNMKLIFVQKVTVVVMVVYDYCTKRLVRQLYCYVLQDKVCVITTSVSRKKRNKFVSILMLLLFLFWSVRHPPVSFPPLHPFERENENGVHRNYTYVCKRRGT